MQTRIGAAMWLEMENLGLAFCENFQPPAFKKKKVWNFHMLLLLQRKICKKGQFAFKEQVYCEKYGQTVQLLGLSF